MVLSRWTCKARLHGCSILGDYARVSKSLIAVRGHAPSHNCSARQAETSSDNRLPSTVPERTLRQHAHVAG
jgi:hypothetical protein